jgi:hypothetical protein
MKIRTMGCMTVGLAALALTACGLSPQTDDLPEPQERPDAQERPESEYAAGVPELGALAIALTDDVDADGLATDDDAVAASGVADALDAVELEEDGAADGVVRPARAVRELNQALRDFLQPIAALVRNTEPSEIQGNVAQWGPVTRGATEYRLFVKRGLLRRYGWLLQARPGGDDAEYANVAAGGIDVGTVVRRGRGTVGVDLDALGDVDPTVAARGKILGAFAHNPAGTVLAYGLKGFTRDAEDTTPIDAAFQGVHLAGGYNRVRVAFYGNLPETATDAEELVLARVRNHRGDGGRADLLITGGDIADSTLWVVSECWDAGLASVYRVVRECPGDGVGGERCELLSSAGEPGACLPDLREPELPPQAPEEHLDDAESPDADLTPPETMPDGEAP